MLPRSLVRLFQSVLHHPLLGTLRGFTYRGTERYCPLCLGWFRRFRPTGRPRRQDAKCPRCGTVERHRLLWLFLQRRGHLLEGGRRMLHVAPEVALEAHFRSVIGDGYVSADLTDPRAMVKIDITDIAYPDDSFDIVYCSHVLEQVEDDRKAMRELRRVLAPGGWAILAVPIGRETTFEDASITTAAERQRVFGQWDHVRIYGRDYLDRLREAGFNVEVIRPSDLQPESECVRMGITDAAGEIFFCRP